MNLGGDMNTQSIAIEHDVYITAGRALLEIQSWDSESFQGNGGTKDLLTLFPSPVTAHPSLLLFLAKFPQRVLHLLSFLSSYYLLGVCPLTLLKLLTSMTCTLLKPIVIFSPHFTSQQRLIELTLTSSFICFLQLSFRIPHTPTALVVLFHLLWLAASLL